MKYLILLILILWFSGCQTIEKKEHYADANAINPDQEYFNILNHLHPELPGFGIDVHDSVKKNRPMAYGLILSAEANRYKHTADPAALEIVRTCGNWLVNNSDLNNNNITGYGLSDSWDAFGDSTVNPIHLEYTITTAGVVKALIDWWEIEKDSVKAKKAFNTALKCLLPYVDDTFDSPSGIPAYSLHMNDRNYDVYNPAVYLAGQMQRISHLTDNDSLSVLLKSKSKKVFSILVENKLKDINGNIYWNYGNKQQRPNDLIHMAYIVEGLRDYKNYGGNLDITWDKIINHIWLFKPKDKWLDRIEKRFHNRQDDVRLWDLGLVMYTLSKESEFQIIDDTLFPQVALYKKPNGLFQFTVKDERSMIRQDAHLLLGLSYYLFNEKKHNPDN
jgi:hypothetical protein